MGRGRSWFSGREEITSLLSGVQGENLRQPTMGPASSLLPSSVQVLTAVVPPASATLVVCRRGQQRTRDHLRPFPAQTETARRTEKKAAKHTAPCCWKQQLEGDGVTALKVVARRILHVGPALPVRAIRLLASRCLHP